MSLRCDKWQIILSNKQQIKMEPIKHEQFESSWEWTQIISKLAKKYQFFGMEQNYFMEMKLHSLSYQQNKPSSDFTNLTFLINEDE